MDDDLELPRGVSQESFAQTKAELREMWKAEIVTMTEHEADSQGWGMLRRLRTHLENRGLTEEEALKRIAEMTEDPRARRDPRGSKSTRDETIALARAVYGPELVLEALKMTTREGKPDREKLRRRASAAGLSDMDLDTLFAKLFEDAPPPADDDASVPGGGGPEKRGVRNDAVSVGTQSCCPSCGHAQQQRAAIRGTGSGRRAPLPRQTPAR